jgi:hypothetical protein
VTEQQDIAQANLHRAIAEHIAAFRPSLSDSTREMIGDWIVVGNVVSFSDEGKMTAYHIAYSDGEMEEHRAIGLLRYAEGLVANGERVE